MPLLQSLLLRFPGDERRRSLRLGRREAAGRDTVEEGHSGVEKSVGFPL